MWNQRAACLLLGLLLLAGAVQRAAATFWLLGGACQVGLGALQDFLGDQLAERGLIGPIEQVDSLCYYMQRYSLEGIAIGDILPLLSRLVSLTASGSTSFKMEAALPELDETIRELARLSERVVGS